MLITITDKSNKERNFDHSQVVGVDDAADGIGTEITLSNNFVHETEADKTSVKQQLIAAAIFTGQINCDDWVPGGKLTVNADQQAETFGIDIGLSTSIYPIGSTFNDISNITVSILDFNTNVVGSESFSQPLTEPIPLTDTVVLNALNDTQNQYFTVKVDMTLGSCNKTLQYTLTQQEYEDWKNNYTTQSFDFVLI